MMENDDDNSTPIMGSGGPILETIIAAPADGLPPMPSVPPPPPPMPSVPPPPPPPPDDDDNANAMDVAAEEMRPPMSLQDALGRSGMYTGDTMMDTSSGRLLSHGSQGVMLYDNDNDNDNTATTPIKYNGTWLLGHWHGPGDVMYSTGDSYSGSFTTSLKHGSGTYTWADGRQYAGAFENDFRHGQGKYSWPAPKHTIDSDGGGGTVISYVGNFEKNQRCGFGTYIDEVSGMEYSGEWHNGLYHGYGIYQWRENPTAAPQENDRRHAYRGNFRQGKPDGQGIEVLPDGSIRHEGIWKDGEPVLSDEQKSDHKDKIQKSNAAATIFAISKSPHKNSKILPTSSSAMLAVATQQQPPSGGDDPPIPPRSSTKSTKKKKSKKPTEIAIIVVHNQNWKDTTTGHYCTYRGLWDPAKQCPDGNGTAVYDSGAVQTYEGCFKAGLYHGQGRLYYRNGDLYEGTFIAGQRHTGGDRDPTTGKHAVALYRWKDGRQYTGQFYANVRQGHGTLVYANQDVYEGDFVAGQREGHGRFVFAADGSCYTGDWQAGQYHGTGTLVHGHGHVYTGQFQNGYEEGKGTLVDATGRTIYDDEWIRGKRRDEVEAAMELLKKDAETKRAAVQAALSDLDQISNNDTANNDGKTQASKVAMLRTWEDQKPPSRKNTATNRAMATEDGDNRPCEAVVNEPVTDLLACPGYYTGIVDSATRLPHGVGRLVYADGKRIHEGFWKEGSKDGHGRCLFFPQGDFHEGEYRKNLRHGPGRYQWEDGRSFNGSYENDLRHGHGVFEYPGGERYDGNFSKGQRSGFGRFDFVDHNNGNRRGYYEGLWKDGLYHGAGHIMWGDGVTYTGEFALGTFHGKGVKRYPTGNVIRDGYWNRGVACDAEDLGMEVTTAPSSMQEQPPTPPVVAETTATSLDAAGTTNEVDAVVEGNASLDSLEMSENTDVANNDIAAAMEEKKEDCDDSELVLPEASEVEDTHKVMTSDAAMTTTNDEAMDALSIQDNVEIGNENHNDVNATSEEIVELE